MTVRPLQKCPTCGQIKPLPDNIMCGTFWTLELIHKTRTIDSSMLAEIMNITRNAAFQRLYRLRNLGLIRGARSEWHLTDKGKEMLGVE